MRNLERVWSMYYGQFEPAFHRRRRYRACNWFGGNVWIDVVVDWATILLFAVGSWRLFGVLVMRLSAKSAVLRMTDNEPRPVNYGESIYQPLVQLAIEFESKLRHPTGHPPETRLYLDIVEGLLLSAAETYRVTLFLLFPTPGCLPRSFPLPAAVPNRTLIECVANLACLGEHPLSRGRLFLLDEFADALGP